MGRMAKGDRHKIVASMPPAAASLVKAESIALGCYVGDYLGWLVSTRLGIAAELPLGEVSDHPDPTPSTDGRVRYSAMVPRAAADEVQNLASQTPTTMGDVVAGLVCEHFDIPFAARIKKAASRTQHLPRNQGRLRMTG